MCSRVFRLLGVAVPLVVLALGTSAFAQEKKPEAKPQEQKKEEPKKEAKDKDIVAVATDAKLSTFVALVIQAGLTKELEKPGPFTVFAPTDEAFKAYKELDDLKKPENKAKLEAFLKGHIVAKKLDLKKDKEAKPMAGSDLKFTEKDGKIMVNDKIAVTKDLTASNGTIHEIGAVIAAAEKKPEIKKEEPKKEEPKKEMKKEEPKKEEPKKGTPKK